MLRISGLPVISIDLETGGLIPGKHTPLAIGAVVVPGSGPLDKIEGYKVTEENSFYIQLEWDTMIIDPRALRVNRLDIVDPPGSDGGMADRSLPAFEGINLFEKWLNQHCETSIHALGMNVGSFDLLMLKSIWDYGMVRQWPFHYRSIDLNSLVFALSQIQNKPFETIKREITKIAWDNGIFPAEMEHHALADAWSNIYIWKECLRRFKDGYEELL